MYDVSVDDHPLHESIYILLFVIIHTKNRLMDLLKLSNNDVQAGQFPESQWYIN